ncbi:GNAT family N-acetyltransferase [Halorientalis pallida]|uniref:GNAT family N-acetyltransferase n=1 Tax=Halorientalis pallida TaxID=2479928 RepID=A0A498KUT1_9EURY|nr:GNAT family N-acetyltransferase [Halorientalis pallida]RXK48004.1 GNAT family N-acetyltransferase [Halorientalis pallida]
MQLHRLVRNRYGRAVYERLQAAGVTATVMSEYGRQLPSDVAADADDLRVEICEPARVQTLDAPTDELVDGEVVVGAFADGAPLGYLFSSVDATLSIHPLERDLSFDGVYVRRVFVAPDHRGQGIAGALLDHTLAHASEAGAERATALVARDNVPSRALFESRDFTVRRSHRYVRVGPVAHYSTVRN